MKYLICKIACLINALVAIHIGLCALGLNLIGRMGMMQEDGMMSCSMVEGTMKYVMIVIGISGVIALVAHIRCWMSCKDGSCK